jgi:hypothetical protein
VRRLAQAVPTALAVLLRDVPLSDGKVDFAWKTSVGPSLERVTAVKLERGSLIVEVPDENWAREMARSRPLILKRMQALLGSDVISEILIRPR